jgi:hypothetical protein
MTQAQIDELIAAASAVVARWDAPLWKDLPGTAAFIERLRRAVAATRSVQ